MKRVAKKIVCLAAVMALCAALLAGCKKQIIRENIGRSPLFSGAIEGTGPRYCPSIEDKIVKFPDKNRHQVFIEPEGEYTNEMYVGGMSSSLPEEDRKSTRLNSSH